MPVQECMWDLEKDVILHNTQEILSKMDRTQVRIAETEKNIRMLLL